MHIVLIGNSNLEAKGLLNYSSKLIDFLKKDNIEIHLINMDLKINYIIKIVFKLLRLDIESLLKNTPLLKFLPKADLIHFTNQFQTFPLFYQKRKSIVTVHDILPIITRDCSLLQRIFYKIIFLSLKRADSLITDSLFTKRCLIKYLKIPSKKIRVIPLGVDMLKFKILKNIKKERYRILYVGSEMPRKNLKTLIYAFAELKKRIPEAKLIKIGSPQWKKARKRHFLLCNKLKIEDSVIFKEYIEDLPAEYNKSELFVFPSLYEGFGLPILEAMACGVPVICSDKTSLPEVAGNAALYFDGQDIKDLADKMFRLLTNKKEQKQLIEKGLKRAKAFSWEKCAKKTFAVYQELEKC